MNHRSRRSFLALMLTLGFGGVAVAQAPERGQLDSPVQDFRLRDVMQNEESWVSLSEFKGKKNVVLVFISYNCDMTWRYEQRLGKLMQDFAGKDVAFLAIRSNARDTAEGIRRYAQAKNIAMPVLYDENNRVADYFGINVTPTFLVIDKEGKLRYWGSYDENMNESAAKKRYVHDAVNAVLTGKDVPLKRTRAFG